MWRKNKWNFLKTAILLIVAMAFVLPGATAIANVEESIENQEFVGIPIN